MNPLLARLVTLILLPVWVVIYGLVGMKIGDFFCYGSEAVAGCGTAVVWILAAGVITLALITSHMIRARLERLAPSAMQLTVQRESANLVVPLWRRSLKVVLFAVITFAALFMSWVVNGWINYSN